MTDALTAPLPIVGLTPLIGLGDPSAASCEGDYCEIPEHHTQAIVNKKLDVDAV